MRLGLDNAGDDKPGERCGAVLDALDIVPKHYEALGDRGRRRLSSEVALQPGARSLHPSAPRTGEGMSSGRNP